MIVAGVMSGTSADGINVALVRVMERRRSTGTTLEFLGHAEFPYPGNIRRLVLTSMNSQRARVADLARLNFLLGELYAEAVLGVQKKLRLKAELVGCHGQTLYHQGTPAPFFGKSLALTWQTGEGAVIAARVGIPVVSDFRPADMAAGGKGAPLVPYLDYLLYQNPTTGRIAQNIGGIANLTAIPAGASLDQVIAFDTGPGNMVMDTLTEQLFSKPFDREGKIAALGRVLDHVVMRFLGERFFRQRPPKTAGREEFGREFAREFLRACRARRSGKGKKRNVPAEKSDVIATATAFTACSIRNAIERFILPKRSFSELIVSGGGAKNPTLMAGLANQVGEIGLRLRSSDEFGIPSDAKEAIAFAVLAFETWNRRPSNVPSATGAMRPAILGKISYP
jgi:anhydro-N-acetylmuramic acid kinase